MSLVPIASLGKHLKVTTPTIENIIHLASLMNDTDYWAEGRTVEKMGLAGLTVAEIRRLALEGDA
jgi:opine dehydrogenase